LYGETILWITSVAGTFRQNISVADRSNYVHRVTKLNLYQVIIFMIINEVGMK